MAFKNKPLLVLLILLVFTASTAIFSYQKTLYQENVIRNLSQQLESQQIQISGLEESIGMLEANLTSTKEKLRTEEEQRNKLEGEVSELKKVSKAEYAVLAVNDFGKGYVIPLEVRIRSGDGRMLLDVANVLFDVSLQESAQQAVLVAREIARKDLRGKDILIIISAPVAERRIEISGGSGGAAITLATIAALEDKNISKKVLITGTINRDHSIGRVAGIDEKAAAARDSGAPTLLVPFGQTTSLSGLEVRQVSTIEEAMGYVIT